jgi:methylated-DNA-[protein]-cysteine S-methyltransferase
MSSGHLLFDTPIGPCGIAWGERGLVALQLPEETPAATRERLLGQSGDLPETTPPRWVRSAVARLVRHLEGRPQDFSSLALDTARVAPFHARVYEAARAIPPGRTRTYGELARDLGSPGASRAVGQALARNPFAIVVPCHRVLASGGRPGGFSARGGRSTKARLLALEGVDLPASAPRSLFRGARGLPFDGDEAVRHVASRDSELARLIERVGPFALKLEALSSPFGSLLEAIVYQQLNGRAAASILRRVKALFAPKRAPSPADVAGASDEALRACGLSRAKVAAVKDLAAKTLDGTVPTLAGLRAMDDAEIVERLTQIRGIGRWTVEMLLIFRLGRPDVLPDGDYGVRKGFAVAMGLGELPSPRELRTAGERWRPYRTVASWYLWRALELAS